jgi:hypothetical protein
MQGVFITDMPDFHILFSPHSCHVLPVDNFQRTVLLNAHFNVPPWTSQALRHQQALPALAEHGTNTARMASADSAISSDKPMHARHERRFLTCFGHEVRPVEGKKMRFKSKIAPLP